MEQLELELEIEVEYAGSWKTCGWKMSLCGHALEVTATNCIFVSVLEITS